MLKAIGKWAVKQAAGVLVTGVIRSFGGDTMDQKIAKLVVDEAVDEMFGE